jgi:hypothetical protein
MDTSNEVPVSCDANLLGIPAFLGFLVSFYLMTAKQF